VKKAIIIGHSTGGMLATRYALMYPELTDQLVMINPIGLEDWKNLGVPSLGVDQWYERELKLSAERVREYERTTYYNGQWKPEYEVWVQMLAGMYRGKGKELVAWNSALIYDMIYTQPVVHEFPLIKTPTFLLMGLKDTTAIGKDAAPADVRPTLGNYKVLAETTRKAIPGSVLVTFPEMGHAPQMQDPVQFHKALLKGLVR
jgi:pimeloyl-ACP methyl ester carboxylesterase